MIETIANLFRLIFKLIKWTIILGVVGFVILLTVGICLHIEQGKITLPSGDDVENVAGSIGGGLAVIGMVVCGVITLWNILKGLSGMSFSSSRSYSAPSSYSAPAPTAAAPKLKRYTLWAKVSNLKGTKFGPTGCHIFEASNITEAEGMLREKLYMHKRIKITKATDGRRYFKY